MTFATHSNLRNQGLQQMWPTKVKLNFYNSHDLQLNFFFGGGAQFNNVHEQILKMFAANNGFVATECQPTENGIQPVQKQLFLEALTLEFSWPDYLMVAQRLKIPGKTAEFSCKRVQPKSRK